MLIGLMLAIVLGALLFTIGMCGVQLDDHPLCAKCGFDLTGKPVDADRCGECGTFLNSAKAIRIGHRRRRGVCIGGGLALLLPALFVSGVFVWRAATVANWLPYIPVSWLVDRASSANSLTRTPALAELTHRYDTGRLSPSQWNLVADAGLAYQGTLSKPWDAQWGDLLEAAQATGQLSVERWKRYVSQSWIGMASLQLRPNVRLGDPLPYCIQYVSGRAAAHSALIVGVKNVAIVWPGALEKKPMQSPSNTAPISMGNTLLVMRQCKASSFPPNCAPGPYTVHIVGDVVVGMPLMPDARGYEQISPLIRSKLDMTGTFTLLRADQATVQLVRSPSLGDAIRHAITFQQCTASNSAMVTTKSLPIGIAFDVFTRVDGIETPIGSVAGRAGVGFDWGVGGRVGVGKKFDVVLRSSPRMAAATIDIFKIWDGEIVIKNLVGE